MHRWEAGQRALCVMGRHRGRLNNGRSAFPAEEWAVKAGMRIAGVREAWYYAQKLMGSTT